MADDGLIAGAAAPASTRLVRSPVLLDALWAASVACALVVSSRLPLIDLDTVYLRMFDPPLRVYAVFIPIAAIGAAAVAAALRSARTAAVASGTLVPSIALGGSLAGSLFLDDVSPFTDAGVPLVLAVSTVGVAMIVRWFVYQPSPSAAHDPRPPRWAAQATVAVGVLLVVNVFVSALRDDLAWSLSSVVATLLMMLTALVVIAAGLFRSVAASAFAAAACGSQMVAVLVVTLDDEGVGLDSPFTLRTGVPGVIGLTCAAAVAVVGVIGATIESIGDQGTVEPTDDVSWRWSSDDV